MNDGRERLRIGGDEWEVVTGNGHSPEHACLYSRERALLVSGDQVLPRISSNVSVQPMEPRADPMADWLAYGLEDALSETPELGVIRKHKTVSGLIKYQPKGEPSDWAAAAKDIASDA